MSEFVEELDVIAEWQPVTWNMDPAQVHSQPLARRTLALVYSQCLTAASKSARYLCTHPAQIQRDLTSYLWSAPTPVDVYLTLIGT